MKIEPLVVEVKIVLDEDLIEQIRKIVREEMRKSSGWSPNTLPTVPPYTPYWGPNVAPAWSPNQVIN